MTKEEYLQEIDIIYIQFKNSNQSEMDHEILATKLMWLTMDYKEEQVIICGRMSFKMNKYNDYIVSIDYQGNVYYGNNHGRFDMYGNPVERTKEKYPYSYDAYVTWKGNYNKYKGDCVYSDRLLNWDWDKYNECVMEVWRNKGQIFYNRTPKDIKKFLSLYYDKEVKLTMIMEGCNVSNGFPYWIFFFEDKRF